MKKRGCALFGCTAFVGLLALAAIGLLQQIPSDSTETAPTPVPPIPPTPAPPDSVPPSPAPETELPSARPHVPRGS